MSKAKKFQYSKAIQTFEREKSVDVKVRILIDELNKLEETYFIQAYSILNKILQLRKNQIKNYQIGSLAKERGIKLSADQIEYIFGCKHISPYSQDKIDRGLLKVSTMLFIIKQDKRLKLPEFQDQIVERFIKGKINTTQISRLSVDMILYGNPKHNELSKNKKQAVKIQVKLLDIFKDIKYRKNLMPDEILLLIKSICKDIIEELNKKEVKNEGEV